MVIDYPLHERIYYLLVAGYDVYGNAGHQLNSRLYMDFLRMEGEFNFLAFLPEAARQPTAAYWYRGAPDAVTEYVYGRNAHFDRASNIAYRTNDPQRELYGLLKARVAPALASRFDLAAVPDTALRRELQALTAVQAHFDANPLVPPSPAELLAGAKNAAVVEVGASARPTARTAFGLPTARATSSYDRVSP